MNRKMKPLADRLWSRVGKRGPDDCWEWQGGRVPCGYGSIGLGRASQTRIDAALALAKLCDELDGSTTLKDRKEYEARLQAYRATAPKPLRTRAEVDAERLLNLDAWKAGVLYSHELSARDTLLSAEPVRDGS